MTKPMDHVAFLSQEIGPRPAGTEEEQQAALYVTEQLQKDAHLSAEIEDFTCMSDAQLPRIICLAVALVAGVLGLVVPVLGIPAVIFAALAGGVYALETLGRPVLSQAFMKGVSQNVVAKYEPARDVEGTGARRRKVIVVAHYDSGHVRRDLAGPFVSLRRPMQYAVMASALLLPIMLLLHSLLAQSPAAGVLTVLTAVLLVLVVLPLAFLLMERYAPYNEAANANASGVAVMLEVARRLGNGEVRSDSEIPAGVMHGEAAAYAAGVVPEGASLSYETGAASEGGLSAAKAAIAAMTGVAPKEYEVQDVASNLVQVKDEPLALPDAAELARMRQETKEALANLPAGTLAEAAARAALLEKEAEYQARLDALHLEEEAQAQREKEAAEAAVAAEAEAQEEQFAYRTVLEEASNVPDWYKKATEKAHAHAAREDASDAPYRSRYADFPPRETEEEASVQDLIEQMYLTQEEPASTDSAQDALTPAESEEEASSAAAVVEIEGDAALSADSEEEVVEGSRAAQGSVRPGCSCERIRGRSGRCVCRTLPRRRCACRDACGCG